MFIITLVPLGEGRDGFIQKDRFLLRNINIACSMIMKSGKIVA